MITQLPMQTLQDVTNAKLVLKNMQERKNYGPLVDLFRKLKVSIHLLKVYRPKEWNNIPLPVQDLSV